MKRGLLQYLISLLYRIYAAPAGMPPKGARAFNAHYIMESLINKFTNKYICTAYLMSGQVETKDNYFREAWCRKG